jgi:hypothetical protein
MSVYISIYMHWGMSQMLCANLLKFEVLEKKKIILITCPEMTSNQRQINMCQHRYSESPKVVRASVSLL